MDRNHVSLLFFVINKLDKLYHPEVRNAVLCLGAVILVCAMCSMVTMFQAKGLTPSLLMQSSVLSLQQAKQDGDKLLALRHASEGMAYLHMARKLASDSSLQAATGLVAQELEAALEASIKHSSA
jgi:hypothetical protein